MPRSAFALDPATAAAAKAHADAERVARRAVVDPARAAEQAGALLSGTAPAEVQEISDSLARLVTTRGLTADEVRALLDAGRDVHGSTREALVVAATSGVRQDDEESEAAAANEADLRATVLPELDLGDLLGGLPDLHDHVHEVARILEMPAVIPAVWALTLVSAFVADRVRGTILEDEALDKRWPFSLHLWSLGAVETGRLKTGLSREMCTDILAEFANHAERAWRPALALDRARRHAADMKIKAQKSTETEKARAMEVLDDRPLHPVDPLLHKVTPEEFESRMLRSGCVALMQIEGNAFFSDFVHQERSKLSALLGGWSGDPGGKDTRTDTRAGDRASFHEYHAVIGLLVQPPKLTPSDPKDRKRLAEAAEEGLFGRFLVHVDDPGHAPPRDDLPPERKRSAATRYARLLRAIAFSGGDECTTAADALGSAPTSTLMKHHPLAPRKSTDRGAAFAGKWIAFEPAAERRLLDFQKVWRKEGERLSRANSIALCSLARKLGEHAARVAATLAVARARHLDRLEPVTLDEVERAIRFCEKFAYPHARHVLDRAEAGELETLERKALQAMSHWQAEHPDKWITPGRFKNDIAKRWPEIKGEQIRDRVKPHERALESLADQGRLRKRPTRGGRGHEYQFVGVRK